MAEAKTPTTRSNASAVGRRSRGKGKVGEREAASYLREAGFAEAKRGQQHRGGEHSADIVGVPGLHVECKRTEGFDPYAWVAQAVKDSGLSGATPVVMHRRNGKPWLAILRMDEFLTLYNLATLVKEHLDAIDVRPGLSSGLSLSPSGAQKETLPGLERS